LNSGTVKPAVIMGSGSHARDHRPARSQRQTTPQAGVDVGHLIFQGLPMSAAQEVHTTARSGAEGSLLLSGVPGSPYTRKMVALLRYRRIPYRLIQASRDVPGLPSPKVHLLPTFYLPGADGALEAVTDSTPLIRRFEGQFSGRHAVPSDPALALIDALIEDYADEWLTKAMFHYRWRYADDIHKAGLILPCWALGPMDDATLERMATAFRDRQIPRLRFVGSNEVTGPVIEASYVRFIDALEDHLRGHRFLLGERPGAADFGVYGQLTQLAHFDPTSMALTLRRAPRVYAWVSSLDDQSGLEPTDAQWFDCAVLPATVSALLCEIGRVYPALMLANAAALQAGAAEFKTEIDGQPWVQQAFPYQGKCLSWLRRDYQALDAQARGRFDRALAGSGCGPIFGTVA
jgi:glutathione S-transferase